MRAIFGDIALGGAVFGGIEVVTLGKSIGQPVIAGVLGLAFGYARYKFRTSAEEKKRVADACAAAAQKAADDDRTWREGVDKALLDLGESLKASGHKRDLAEAEARAPFAALEAKLEASVKQYEDAHARWRREFDAMSLRAEQIITAAGKHSSTIEDLAERLDALENGHVDGTRSGS